MTSVIESRRHAAVNGALAIFVLSSVLLSPASGHTEVVQPGQSGSPDNSPFFMFSTRDAPDAHEVLAKYFTDRDYISLNVSRVSETLRKRVPRAHRYALPTHLGLTLMGIPGVQRWAERGCIEDTPGLILYDPEHWPGTPDEEQNDIPSAVLHGAELAHSTGCHTFGFAPDGIFMFGMDPDNCAYNLDAGVYRQVDWRVVDLVDIQAQRLLSDDCADRLGLDEYLRVVSEIAEYARAQNPDVKVVSQVSFRYTSAGKIKRAISQVSSIVDGIYLAYPITNQEIPCEYCSPSNLESVLRFFRLYPASVTPARSEGT